MSTLDVQTLLNVQTLKSNTANTPPVIQDANGTQVGTLCRAWVNFNGGGTVAIRGAFNVSTITDRGVGQYTVNFTNAMPDVNYAFTVGVSSGNATNPTNANYQGGQAYSTTALGLLTSEGSNTANDYTLVNVAIFR